MDLFPAIDIRHGRVVRLAQGEAARATVYDEDPVAQAVRFVEQGARWIHVVDLDRAFGDGDNTPLVAAIARTVGASARVQAGGGFRSRERVEAALAAGVARVVIGTAAVTDPGLVQAVLAEAGPERLAVGLDARDGEVAVRGWTEGAGVRLEEAGARMLALGVTTLVYTDIGRDGMLVGPDVAGAQMLQSLGARVIASGGVGALAHLRAVADAGLAGAIVGRALYERRFTLPEALACCSPPA